MAGAGRAVLAAVARWGAWLMGAPLDLSGQRFGRLVVLSLLDRRTHNKLRWLCECDCGRQHEITGSRLTSGGAKSCGCLRTTHGQTKTRLYRIWRGMRARCGNPNSKDYPRYGGRGIVVCDAWADDFGAFSMWARANGYDDRLSIDRVDNSLGYSPENCRWADTVVQGTNRRSVRLNPKLVHEIKIAAGDGPCNLSALGRSFGVAPATIRDVLTGKCWGHVQVPSGFPRVVAQ